MGKGDKKTKKGKIIAGSYGITRPRKKKKSLVVAKPKRKKAAPKAAAKPKGPSPTVKACMQGAQALLSKGMITKARFPKGIRRTSGRGPAGVGGVY